MKTIEKKQQKNITGGVKNCWVSGWNSTTCHYYNPWSGTECIGTYYWSGSVSSPVICNDVN